MANVFGTPGKGSRRRHLFQIGVQALQEEGWTVEKIAGVGKASVRRIRKGKESRVVSIRTTQDTAIAFPRDKRDSAWVTLSDVDAVVAVSVDDPAHPRFAQVHLIEGDEMRERFDRAYHARKAAGHSIPLGRGVWLSLYLPDADSPASQVGAGAGLDHPAFARVPLEPQESTISEEAEGGSGDGDQHGHSAGQVREDSKREPLTIREAKLRLALSLGVEPSNIRISVEA